MRVLVSGGRTFLDTAWLHGGLDLLDQTARITEIIEGEAPGADVRARWWGETNGVKVTGVRAEWEAFNGKLKAGMKNPAGAIRNGKMLDLMPDVVLACPGGPGTKHMVAEAKRRGMRVIYLEKMPLMRSERHPDDTSGTLLS